ncbi:DUF6701 domain-containing protein [Vibrio sp. YIC-376]|uniref:DUF6701 domain-containing protein n=1 Tax=Vibrio sp. YIC-376 TaxID=3136162 RepID=UPI00402B005E
MTNYFKKFVKVLVLLNLLMPAVALASGSYSSGLCKSGLNSRYDFSIYAPIPGNDPRETIYVNRENPRKKSIPVVLWTNDDPTVISSTVIRDTDKLTVDDPALYPEKTYYIWLTYEAEDPSHGDNKKGVLSYYFYVNNQWKFIIARDADLTGLDKPQLYIYGEENLPLECSGTIEPPEPPLPPVSDEGTFIVEPQWKYGLTCERIPVDFKLVNEQNQLVDTDASFKPLVSPSNGTSWCSGETGDNCGIGGTNLVNGQKTLYISVQDIGEYSIGATYDYESYSGGSVEFVPYKLHATPSVVEMIAGKDASVSVQALSCYGDQTTVVKNYNSSLAMSSNNYELEKPSTGSLYDFNVSDLQFTNGDADATVTWRDVGQTKVTVEDANFDCRAYEQEGENLDCPIDGGVLKGEFSVKSRPWKFALCPRDSSGKAAIADGTSQDGNAYVAAGESFSVRVAPLIFNSSECATSEQLTQNYFLSEAAVDLSHSLDTPQDAVLGNLTGLLTRQVSESDKENSGYIFSGLSYDEVGSIQLSATEKGVFYSSIEVDGEKGVSGERTIGRFYPKYFRVYADDINTNEWAYPTGQGFTYMGQPFGAEVFYVEALNASKERVSNYKSFDESLKAEFNLIDTSSYAARFSSLRSYTGEWQNHQLTDVDNRSIGRFTGSASDGLMMTKNTSTYEPDGPLNQYESGVDTDISIYSSSDNADPVLVDGNDGVLNIQPDIRFGRVDLDDVGGRQGETLRVPLRVEYWNGSRFVVNANDNQTVVKGVTAAEQHIWPIGEGATPKSVTLGAGGEVVSGTSRAVTATQAEAYRQQTRVWLDLEDSANGLPWLKYDWDNDGSEENPSSVVTFGIHRGNDRVIYRGEPGLTGH